VPERTTLTLEDDVMARLREEARRSGRPFKTVVNEAIRAGLGRRAERLAAASFNVRARDLGVRPGVDLDDIEGLLDRLEGPTRR
jgi:predicted transcriptional regulator